MRAQKELADRTTKIEPVVVAEPTRRIVREFSDDEHDVEATARIDAGAIVDDDEEDEDDIVVSLPTAPAAQPAPKTPSAADMRARARAIDAAASVKSPTVAQLQVQQPQQMSLEQRVAALERELAEEREARRALERKIAHLLK